MSKHASGKDSPNVPDSFQNAFGDDVDALSVEAGESEGKTAGADGQPAREKAAEDLFESDTPPSCGKKKHRMLRIVIIAAACLAVTLLIAGIAGVAFCLRDLPDCSDTDSFNTIRPTEVYANDHETLLARFQLENRIPLSSLDEVGDYAKKATIAVEDERFYQHFGVDPQSIIRALFNNLTGGRIEGASTITQQLVRNTVLSNEMSDISLKRKVREAYLAMKMERLFSKDEIFLLYLNTINYGSGAYGIEAAAQRYFSKSASELELHEAALLAGIPQSPVYNDPTYYPDHALERRNLVLDRMLAHGDITEEECQAAKEMPVELELSEVSVDGIVKYPYFASYVRQELAYSYHLSTSDVFQGGLTIYTTLDPDIQEAAEAAVSEKEATLAAPYEVALVAIEPNTGYIKALVGGRDYYENQYNLVTQAQRQAGSSFKTFTLVTAIESGISPQQVVNCGSSVTIGNWKVANIYNINYSARSIASAFAVSSNTGFARLISALGPSEVAKTAYRMGITSALPEVPALTLGAGEVTPLEMASAYATLATGGERFGSVAIEQVIDRKGNVLIDNTSPQGERAVSPEVAAAATSVMRGVVESGEGTGTDARLSNGQPVAGKTGTSENFKDSWFCGFTPQYSVAVWIGDRTNTQALPSYVTSSGVFSAFLNRVLVGSDPVDFPAAGEPSYTRSFPDGDLGVQITTSSEREEAEKKKKEEEEKKKKEEEEKKKKEEEEKKKKAEKEEQKTPKIESDKTGNGSGVQ